MIGDDLSMIKQIAWNTFKNTGNINTYLEFVEVENLEKTLEQGQTNSLRNNIEKVENNVNKTENNNLLEAEKQNGNIEIKRNSNSGTQYERL